MLCRPVPTLTFTYQGSYLLSHHTSDICHQRMNSAHLVGVTTLVSVSDSVDKLTTVLSVKYEIEKQV